METEVLQHHFGAICALFKYYGGFDEGDSATINITEFDHFLGRIRYFGAAGDPRGNNFSAKVAVENIFKYGGTVKPAPLTVAAGGDDGTPVSTGKMQQQPARSELCRHEFIGCLIALACYRYDHPLSSGRGRGSDTGDGAGLEKQTLAGIFVWFCREYIEPVSTLAGCVSLNHLIAVIP